MLASRDGACHDVTPFLPCVLGCAGSPHITLLMQLLCHEPCTPFKSTHLAA